MKKFLSLWMALTLLMGISLSAPVEASAKKASLNITNAEQLISLSKSCTLDSYSYGLTVSLSSDIDLKGTDFTPIPYFNGTFYGNNHVIKGYSFTGEGSHLGLFRYVGSSGRLVAIRAEGTVTPSGSATVIGGLVGENLGEVTDCSFQGKVRGVQYAGGIAGKNSGILSGCRSEGSVAAEHQSGGICGENYGVIDDCTNFSKVNETVISSRSTKTITGLSASALTASSGLNFDVSQLSEDDFLNITDIGGIAGNSSGQITNCENKGSVSCERTGYNVGGIAGRQSGRISSCTNDGIVSGRKDAGGIAGQAEPYAAWDFSQSKLTELKNHLTEIQTAVQILRSDAKGSSGELEQQLSSLLKQVDKTISDTDKAAQQVSGSLTQAKLAADNMVSAIDEALDRHDHQQVKLLLRQLKDMVSKDNTVIDLNDVFELIARIRQEERQHLENDLDSDESLSADIGAILSSVELTPPDTEAIFTDISGISDSVQQLHGSVRGDSVKLQEDLRGIYNACAALPTVMETTAEELSEVHTDYQTDISAADPERFQQGVIQSCKNNGDIKADNNVGGIAGTVSFEISFDAEDKLKISDYLLSDARYMVFAVISGCESGGEIIAKKSNAGGIAGGCDFGLIQESIGSGTIRTQEGDYCGGVAGDSKGTIRRSYSRCLLYGNAYIGGIAGKANDLSVCKAYTYLKKYTEQAGSIAGSSEGNVEKCYFVENDIGGIDGISYSGKASPVSYDAMKNFSDIPEIFRTITVTFIAQDQVVEKREVPFGGSIDRLPEVPMDGVRYWKWNDFDHEHIYYSLTVEGEYRNPKTSISTAESVPLYLAEGNFYEGQHLTAELTSPQLPPELIKHHTLLSAQHLSVNDYTGQLRLRMKTDDNGLLYLSDGQGGYVQTDYTRDGSYIVFDAPNNCEAVYISALPDALPLWVLIAAGIGAAAVIVLVVILIINLRKRRRQAGTP